MPKTTAKTTQKTSSKRANGTVILKKKPKSRQTTPAKRRFWCDCMMAVGFLVLTVFGAAQYVRQLTNHTTQVLGVSTRLDTDEILLQLNLERARAGLGPLTFNDQLNRAAAAKGANMFQDSYWAHVNPDGTQPWAFIQAEGYEFQSAGENLARDFSDERSLVDAWMASSSHRANVLNGSFQDTGLAVLDGQIDGQNVLLVVNLFAQPKTSPGQITQVAVYNSQTDDLVLAGQVLPSSEIIAARRFRLNAWQWALVVGLVLGISLVMLKIGRPFGYRRGRRR